MRDRSMVFVIRDGRILMERLFYDERYFYSIPGGGVEPGETPEEAAVRELREECGLEGQVVRKLTELYKADGSTEYVFEVRVPEEQMAVLGSDPEEPADRQPIKAVCWKRLEELTERDRAFMWAYGLMEIGGFFEETLRWGDRISYPTEEGTIWMD